ncbi:hypothetical protein EDD18DRAFT_1358319 [Armillaria luteobubalina]|uniref:Uncharacterized protein n=1 Tax=Armillaria luteobubalina TaxID=153913 RepID=A0AA39TJL7_9AGAR|nr:hypothetical protein EDD18DRAFT_1358319 [Armillaria luteobubalina]
MSRNENSSIIWCYGFENATRFRSDGIYNSHQYRLRFTNTLHDLIALGLRPSPEHEAESRHRNPAMSLFTFIDDSVTIQAHTWHLLCGSTTSGSWRLGVQVMGDPSTLTYTTQHLASVHCRFSLASWVADGKVTMYTDDVLNDGSPIKKHQCQVKFVTGHMENVFIHREPIKLVSGRFQGVDKWDVGRSVQRRGYDSVPTSFALHNICHHYAFGLRHIESRNTRLRSKLGQTNIVTAVPVLIDDDDDDASPPTPLCTTPTRIRLLSVPTAPRQPFLLLKPPPSLLPPTPTPTQDTFTRATES